MKCGNFFCRHNRESSVKNNFTGCTLSTKKFDSCAQRKGFQKFTTSVKRRGHQLRCPLRKNININKTRNRCDCVFNIIYGIKVDIRYKTNIRSFFN